jgi:hypothetical protein
VTALDHPLVGSWRLRRWTATAEDGTESLPMGDVPVGLLVYAADGSMLAGFGRGDRLPFDSDDVTGGTDDERARAFSTYIAYGGTYEVDGDTVEHRVETSLFPNWVGTVQRRRWELDETGRQLTLSSPPISLGGATRSQQLTWERARG